MEGKSLHIYSKAVKPSSQYTRFQDVTQYDFQTGDILLFHNTKNCFFKMVECCTHSKYSHVAMIIKDPMFTTPSLKGLYIIESGTEPFRDVENKRFKFGVQIVPLQLVLATYKGSIYWRKMVPTNPRDDKFERTLALAHNYVHNLPYDINPFDWFNAAFGNYEPSNKKITQQKGTFWCSALIAFIYTMMGLLPKGTPWSYIKPVDWGTEHPTPLQFHECVLEQEVKIKSD